MRLRTFLPLLLAIGACGLDQSQPPPDESTTDQGLTANEIDSSWFTDAQFTNQVGESDLYCSGGKYQSGTINTKYVARFTYPCHGGAGTATCYEATGYGWQVVTCPAWVF